MTKIGIRTDTPRFLVLMATYNGALFLDEQLDTLRRQTVACIDLLVSDDGSTDTTRDILAVCASGWKKGSFDIAAGPRGGFAENFRSLVLAAELRAEYYAFCDQDDVWDLDKLEYAALRLASFSSSEPALYCGSTRTMTEDGRVVGTSPIMMRAPSFRNALVQSIAGGNTMVMNRAAFSLLRESCRDVRFVSHDWWTYLVLSGAGAAVIYDPVPKVSYRQHGANLVGSNASFLAKLDRLKRLLGNQFRIWHDINLSALRRHKALLSSENSDLLERIAASRSSGGGFRVATTYRRLGLYRQSFAGHLMLFLGAILGKI